MPIQEEHEGCEGEVVSEYGNRRTAKAERKGQMQEKYKMSKFAPNIKGITAQSIVADIMNHRLKDSKAERLQDIGPVINQIQDDETSKSRPSIDVLEGLLAADATLRNLKLNAKEHKTKCLSKKRRHHN